MFPGNKASISLEDSVKNYDRITLNPGLSILVSKAPISPGSSVHSAVMVTVDPTEYKWNVVADKFHQVAKVLRPEYSSAQNNYILSMYQKAGLSAPDSQVKQLTAGKQVIFMSNIDAGLNLEKILSGVTHGITIHSIFNCIMHAMQSAAYLRDKKGLVHFDISPSNIMFPSGVCVDFEYCAEANATLYASFSPVLFNDPAKLKLLLTESEDRIPPAMISEASNGKITINKMVVEYQFSFVIGRAIATLRPTTKEDIHLIKEAMKIKAKLESGACDLPQAIAEFRTVLYPQLCALEQLAKYSAADIAKAFASVPNQKSDVKDTEVVGKVDAPKTEDEAAAELSTKLGLSK